MDLQFPNGQLTYVAGEGITASGFVPLFGGLLQAHGKYPGETRVSFSCKLSTTGGRFIISSDGVWDALTAEVSFNFSRGLSPEAAAEQIVKYHPDMNKSPGAEEMFKEISAAYERYAVLEQILSDEEKRSLYDSFGEAGLGGDYGGGDFGTHGIDPYELFNAFFGGSDKLFGDSMGPGRFRFSSKVKDNRGFDIRHDLVLSFEESIIGGKREINIFRHETCGTCHGTGAKSSNGITECTQCRGQGRLMKTQRTPFGIISQVETIEGFKDLYIPPGTQPGEKLKFAQLGAPDIKKPKIRGDHYFVIKVKIPKNISDRERSLVEELSALKGTQGISLPDEETINRGNLRKRSLLSSARKQRSLWGSIRNLFGGDEGDQRFASISAQSVIPRWTSQRGIHPAVPVLEGCLMLMALLFVISRTGKLRLIPKWYDRPTQAKEAEDGE